MPSAAQKELVRSLGATATWNDFGTPQSLIANDGYLATGLGGSDAAAARAFITKNRSLFRLPRGR
jgi:hypothetical protein